MGKINLLFAAQESCVSTFGNSTKKTDIIHTNLSYI